MYNRLQFPCAWPRPRWRWCRSTRWTASRYWAGRSAVSDWAWAQSAVVPSVNSNRPAALRREALHRDAGCCLVPFCAVHGRLPPHVQPREDTLDTSWRRYRFLTTQLSGSSMTPSRRPGPTHPGPASGKSGDVASNPRNPEGKLPAKVPRFSRLIAKRWRLLTAAVVLSRAPLSPLPLSAGSTGCCKRSQTWFPRNKDLFEMSPGVRRWSGAGGHGDAGCWFLTALSAAFMTA